MGQFLPVLCTAATAEGTMAGLLKIYGQSDSGNCHKVKFTADRLGIPNEWIETNNMVGEARTPEFLAINAFAEVPAVVLPDGRPLWQSNAIVQYLAEGSELLPDDAYSRAQVSAWQFWEQYSHEPYIAVCRAQLLFRGFTPATLESWRVERGNRALEFMEAHLAKRDWFVGERLTVADISLFAYTRLAHEGNFNLALRPRVRNWVARTARELGVSPV